MHAPPPTSHCRTGLIAALLAVALVTGSHAATITKAATGTDLTAGASWGGSAPGSGDVAAWAGTSLSAGLTLGSSSSWSGISVAGALGNISVNGAGPLTLGSGGIDMSAATVNLTWGTPIALGTSQTWNVNSGRTLTASGIISGTGMGLTKAGAGTLTLNGANTYTGGTTINAGTLTQAVTQNANWAGTGPITVQSAGTLNLNNNNIASTVTLTLNGGMLISGNGLLSTVSGPVVLGATSTFNISGGISLTNTVSGTGGLIKTGSSTLPLNGASNTYTGLTTVNAGNLQVKASIYGNNTALWTPANITVANGATLALNVGGPGEFTTAQAATMFGNLSTVNNNGLKGGSSIAFDTSNASGTTTYAGVLTDSSGPGGGALGLKKLGANTLELTGANSYTGVTTVSAGTLQYDGSLSGAGAAVSVSGGTLGIGAGAHVARNVIVSSGALNLAGTVAGTLTVTGGSVSTSAGAPTITSADFSAGAGTVNASTPLAITSTLQLPGATATLAGGTSFTAQGANLASPAAAATLTLSGGTLALNAYTILSAALTNPSFETDAGTVNSYKAQTITGWTNSAGTATYIEQGSSRTFAPAAPPNYNASTNYKWAAFQAAGTFSQTFNVTTAGNYTVAFAETGRPGAGVGGAYGPLYVQAQFDATNATSVLVPSTSSWASITSNSVYLTAGSHTLNFVFTNPLGGDKSSVLDAVAVTGTALTSANLAATSVAATAGSVLDLSASGGTHTLASLNLTAGGATTALSLRNGASLTLNGDGNANAIAATGSSGQSAGIVPDPTSPPSLIIASGKNVSVDSGVTLTVQSAISGGQVTKTGGGTLALTGSNTYTGATTITGGTLALGAAGSIDGSPAITLAAGTVLDVTAKASYAMAATPKTYTFHVDGSGAGSCGRISANSLDVSNANVILAIDSPLGNAVYVLADYTSHVGTVASVTGVPAGYTIVSGFNGGTRIALVPIAVADYYAWVAGFPGLSDTSPTADPDGDGLTNLQEFAFGLDPTSASSSNIINVPLDKSTGQFYYTRRNTAETGLTYRVWISTDTLTWQQDPLASQVVVAVNSGIETVQVTLSVNPRLVTDCAVTFDGDISPGRFLSFGLPGNPATISGSQIALTVPAGTDVTSLAPVFMMSPGALCDRGSGTAHDFTNPVTYTLTSPALVATSYTVTVTVSGTPASSAKDMLNFDFGALGPAVISGTNINNAVPGGTDLTTPASAVISGTNINIAVPGGTDLTTLAPTYTVSPFAWSSPPSRVARDFTNPQTYTVTAQDGTTHNYMVTVAPSPQGDARMLNFWLPGNPAVINDAAATIILSVPYGTDVTSLAPLFTLSPGSTCYDHAFNVLTSGTIRDFTTPQYVVVIDDFTGNYHEYFVTVVIAPPASGSASYNLGTSPAGTTINGNGASSLFVWIPKGSLPVGSILRSVTASNVKIENNPSDSWASDLGVFVDPTPEVPGGPGGLLSIADDTDFGGASNSMNWHNQGQNNGPMTVTLTAGPDFPDTIDLGTAAVMIGSGWGTATWSGNLTVTYDVPGGSRSAKDILTFNFGTLGPAVIAGTNISITVPNGTDVTALAPTFTLSAGATCDHTSGAANNFTNPVSYTVTAADLTTKVYAVTVNMPPGFTSAAPSGTGVVGTAYNFTCTASGTTPITFAVTTGFLPTGLTLGSGGVISGTPDATGTFTGTITATNGTLPDATQDFSITITQAPSFTSAVPTGTGVVGSTYNFTCTASGTTPTTFAVTSGSLPTGLTLGSGGVIYGTPGATGTFTGTITASNGTLPSATQDFSITITQAPAFTSAAPTATGVVGTAYNFTCTASGTTPITFAVTSGFLPTGLTLGSGGVISGTPSATGTFTGTITASNGTSPNATRNFSITISPAPAPVIVVEQPPGTGLINGLASINCGSVSVGGSSDAFIVTVRNTGTADLTFLAMVKDGANAGDFTIGSLSPTVLAAGTSTTFTVTFAPGATGVRTAAIHIASNDAYRNPFDIQLTGSGTNAPSFIDNNPASQSVENGSTATLTANAGGFPVPSLQWYQGASGDTSNPVGGATGGSFTTPALTGSTSYWVRASNAYGTADSATAVLTVVASSNANLGDLAVSAGTLVPAFGPAVTSYQVALPTETTTMTVTPTLAHALATALLRINDGSYVPIASGDTSGALALDVGVNLIEIRVTAQNGSTRSYAITVTRAAPPMPDLVVGVTAPATGMMGSSFDYALTVANTGTAAASGVTVRFAVPANLTVQATASPDHGFTTLSTAGGFVMFANGTLAAGESSILTVTVVPVIAATYTAPVAAAVADPANAIAESDKTNNSSPAAAVTVVRPPDVGPVITSQPPAGQTIESYTLVSLSVAASGSPTPGLQWYRGVSGDTSNPVAGATAATFSTAALSATTSFWVRAANTLGTADSDTATITVVPSTNADLANLALSSGSLAPAFATLTTVYAATVPNAVASVTVTPAAANAGASVMVNGAPVASGSASAAIPLGVGSNVITTSVTAADGTTNRSYTISITRALPMAVTTNPADGLTADAAVLHGTVNPHGAASMYFEYGTTTSYGGVSTGNPVSGEDPVAVSIPVSGLAGATIYHFRAVAVGAGSTVYGADQAFTTTPEPPLAATGNPVALTGTGATLVGAVNPRGLPAEVHFEYGLTAIYGATAAVTQAPAGSVLADVTAPVSGLIAGATYHCRVVATTAAGTTFGEDISFVATAGTGSGTGSPSAAPGVTTGDVAAVTNTSAELLGSVESHGGTTLAQFEYGTTDSYGSVTAQLGVGNGDTAAAVSLPATGLSPGTVYHYRLSATNSLGTSRGADLTFTSLFPAPEAVTGNATALSTTSARVTGSVRAHSTPAAVSVDYGTDPALLSNSVVADPAAVDGDSFTSVGALLVNLSQGTTYYYRVRAESAGGVATGAIQSFDVGVLSGLFRQFPPPLAAADHQGSLTVDLTPSGIGGAWRFAGESQWRLSDIAATGLASGDRVVEYRPVPGYLQPAAETAVVISGAAPVVLARAYTATTITGGGGLIVTLKPENLAATSVPADTRAQWRLFGEDDSQWKDSGTVLTGMAAGDWLIECKPVAGRTTPMPVTARVSDGATTAATVTYYLTNAAAGTPPQPLTFEAVSAGTDLPYAYVGQITSDVGVSSGFVVRPRVVATAGHVVFDDGTLTFTTGLRWLFQRDPGVNEPVPQVPRGNYLLSGYAAQRAADNSPGSSTPQSQNLDAAAMYFLEDAGRGGFSGYLASDSLVNEFVVSADLKTLVGYPVDGIDPALQGRLHATPVSNITFSPAFGQTYTTSDVRSSGGNSGGPLCVQYSGGTWYPAAIYLGGTAQTVVRAIDGDVVDLFGFAEASGNAGVGSTGGSLTQSGTSSIGTPALGALQVMIEPAAARAAGAGWRIQAQANYQAGGARIDGLSPNNYTIGFATVAGFVPPAPQAVTIVGGQLTTLTFTYEAVISPPVINSPNTVTGTRGQPLAYQISALNSPGFYSLSGSLPAGMSFNSGSGLISGIPLEAGNFPVTVGATNAGGSDSRLVNLTCCPVVPAQSLTAPYQQAMSYQIASSESGTGVTYAANGLPDGLALDPASGWITGSPATAGVFVAAVTVSKKGASATNNLTLTITGTAPVITLQPVAGKTVEYGLTTTLQVAASGLPAPTYQWYEGYSGDTGQPVAGAGSATFTTPPLTYNTRYWARASSISGSADSTATEIHVLPSANAKLSNLWLNAADLTPGFNADILTYTAAIPYATGTVSLIPEVQVAQSTVTINGAPVPSLVAGAPIPMAVGPNAITVTVTAGDGLTNRSYVVTVTRAQPPSCATLAATNANDISAQLNGTVTPNSPVSVMFQYGRTAGYGGTTSGQYVTGASPLQIQAPLTGLTGNVTYHYRIVVSTGAEMFFGDDMTFTTTLERPLAATGNPAAVTPTSARLIGAVNPKGEATTVYFEYGLTTAYGTNITPAQSPAAGSTVVDMWADVAGLTPGGTYHYRIVASSDAGTSYGDDVSFQANSGGSTGDGIVKAPPTVTTGGTADLTSSTATLLGTVNPNEGTTFVHFEYGLSTAYGSTTASAGIGNGYQAADVTLPVTGLVPGTLYHYRLVASNSLGVTDGGDMAFTAVYNPPVCTTGTAVALSPSTATLNGSVSARGTDAEVWFDYGVDGVTFPNSVRALPSTVSGDAETAVSVDLSSLIVTQIYYYKIRAVSSGGTASGDPRPLQTGALLGLQQEFTRVIPASDLGGQIQVNLLPAGVGGWRFVGETQWRAPGVMVTGLPTAQRDIEYLPVAGRIQPQGETVDIASGEPPVVLERAYYDSAAGGTGTLRVLLDPQAISLETVALASRAQWRIVGDSDPTWLDSGSERDNLMPGSYLIECKPVAGRNTPQPINMLVTAGATTTSTLTYFAASAPSLNPPVVVPFATASTSQNMPYAYCGQIRGGTGTYSGFVVKPRVVATAAQAVFDEASLSVTSNTQWLLQRDNGTYEPDPLVPRGVYLFDGYAAQRALENTPGTLGLASQNLNVAALWFDADAGRGGMSGFLASDAAANEYLQSASLKVLVGYPVNGISSSNQGRMHTTVPVNAAFTLALDRTFVTTGIRGVGGMAGGPLCVQYNGGAYYPAGIYVGGTSQSAVRAIDSRVIDLFTRAETSGNGGDNNTGGGITHSSFTSIGSATQPGALKVTILPLAAQTAGAGWQLKPETTYRLSGAQKVGLNAGSYVLQLKTVGGYQAPTQQTVTITGGQLADITFTYQEVSALDAWRMANFGTYNNTGIAADGADADGDGQTNLAEYIAGTDPNKGSDFLRILTTTKTATSCTVTAAGKAGRIYVLERNATPGGGTWTAVATSGTLAADGTVTLTDSAPLAKSGFYRLRVTLP